MKTGEFASSNKISIDTVRHYVELGLILPERKGSQYSFDERCTRDLSEVLELKEMGFLLDEIKSILAYERLGKLTTYQEALAYQDIYKNRLMQISSRIDQLQKSKVRLEKMISALEKPETEKCRYGFDFRQLGLFCCPKCGGVLMLSEARIIDDLITDARLGCKCGKEFTIEDGILFAGGCTRGTDEFDEGRISEYIESTDEAYLRNVYRGLEWIRRKLDFKKLDGKVLLELGSGYGFFIRHIYEELPGNTVYIAVDRDLNSHRFLKSMLEKSGIRKNIIFVCSDFLELPLKPGTADFLLDLSGTSNYSFEHEDFLPAKISGFLKSDGILLGNYLLFKNFAFDSQIAEPFRKNFRFEYIKQMLESSGFGIIDEAVGDYLENGGRFESYFKKGEKVYAFSLQAKRRG